MSSFDKLRVNGIRSFAPANAEADKTKDRTSFQPRDENTQGVPQSVLVFQRPLTIIIGNNGSGKTTLIECLKYATTGEAPTGNKQLNTFIHDPKINFLKRIDAAVQLKFNDVNGKSSTVTRRLSATVKAKKVECRSDEATISRINASGKELKISSKINDVDREMPLLLGVSKAVLNNVIFCHQDSSNWPLDDPKKVKEKFDDIFSATRYVKCLDAIKKQQTILKTKIRDSEKDFNHHSEQRKLRKEDEKQKEDMQKDLREKADELEEKKQQLGPIERKVDAIQTKLARYNEIQNQLHAVKVKQEMLKSREGNLKKIIADEWTGTIEQLEQTIADFEHDNRDPERRHGAVQAELERLTAKQQDLVLEEKQITTKMGSLRTSVEMLQNKTQGLLDKLEVAVNANDIQGVRDRVHASTAEMQSVVNHLDTRHRQLLDDKNKIEDRRTADVSSVQSERDRVVSESAGLRRQQEMHLEQTATHQADIATGRQALAALKGADGRIRDLDAKIEAKEGELNRKKDSDSGDSHRRRIEEAKRRKGQLVEQLRDLNTEVHEAQATSAARNELSFMEKSVSDKRRDRDDILDQNRATIRKRNVFGEQRQPDPDDFKRQVDKRMTEARQNRVDCESKVQKLQMELNDVQLKCDQLQLRIGETEWEAKEIGNKMDATIGTEDITGRLEELDLSLKTKRKEKGLSDGGEQVLQQYVESLEERPCCPLCERNFRSAAGAQDLATKLRTQLTELPSKSRRLEAEIAEAEQSRSGLLEAKPLYDRRRMLVDRLLPDLRTQLEELKGRRERTDRQLQQETKSLKSAQEIEASVSSLVSAAVQVEALQQEIRQIDSSLAEKRRHFDLSGGRSVEDIQRHIDSTTKEKETLETDLEQTAAKLEKHKSAIQQLETQLNELRNERVSLKERQQQATSTQERIEAAERSIEQLSKEISSADAQLRTQTAQLREIEVKMETVNRNADENLSDINDCITTLARQRQEISMLLKEVVSLERDGVSRAALSRVDMERRDVERRLTDTVALIDRQRQELADLAEERTHREFKKTQFKANLELLQNRQQLTALESELRQIGGDSADMNEQEYSELERERKRLAAEQIDLHKFINQREGAVAQLESALKESVTRLKRFDGTEQAYTTAKIDFMATSEAFKDLTKYYKALDHAILKYHSEKMADINRLLKEYWLKVYECDDIKYIQIRSEETDETKADKRRTYNYRVMMIMDSGHELEMRGRCSAGQRVLASILIRLTLAEVFCINCGMLTLDEPTANLDIDKVASLSQTLINLVDDRREHSNFQLLIITHDQRFLQHMVRGCGPEFFFSVKKDHRGYSQLTRHKAGDANREIPL